jgi:transcriptional regulator with XRE-family HTH domain
MVRKSFVEIAGYSPDDPEVLAEQEDFDQYLWYTDCLVKARADQGLSQTAVARRMGTTQSAVSDLERSGSDPRVSTLMRYARALGAPLRFRAPVFSQISIEVTTVPASAVRKPLIFSGWTSIPKDDVA